MYTATLYLTGSSKSLPVLLNIDSREFLIVKDESSNQVITQVAFNTLKTHSKLGNLPREVHLPDNQALHIDACEAVDNWLFRSTSGKLYKLESNFRFILTSILLVPLCLVGIFKFVLPAMAIHFADLVPEYATELASNNTMLALNKSVLDPSELPENKQQYYINRWQQMVTQLPVDHHTFQFQFKKSEYFGANAFALPNGTIVVTDDLVELLDGQDSLLAAIILHEIGHVVEKHSMRFIAESIISSLAIDYLIGDLGGTIEVFAGVSNTIVQNQFSQDLEWEADNFSLKNIHLVGYSPKDFATAMQKLSEQSKDSNQLDALLHSHPLTKQRIDNAMNFNSSKKQN